MATQPPTKRFRCVPKIAVVMIIRKGETLERIFAPYDKLSLEQKKILNDADLSDSNILEVEAYDAMMGIIFKKDGSLYEPFDRAMIDTPITDLGDIRLLVTVWDLAE